MPLSHEEQKLLEQLEQELNIRVPLPVRQFLLRWLPPTSPATYLGLLAMVCGGVVLILGVASQLTAVGVAGFLLMGGSTYWMLSRIPALHRRD
ncbi:MAG TPA: DUF3040 domain-containing protein [Micrococcaceae bacterium]|jgi:uncharacterized membrane protein YphA (DoxX/SURF4 family)|nr:DUF3040 domain-containing protein [Micrococcaceae bacterium]